MWYIVTLQQVHWFGIVYLNERNIILAEILSIPSTAYVRILTCCVENRRWRDWHIKLKSVITSKAKNLSLSCSLSISMGCLAAKCLEHWTCDCVNYSPLLEAFHERQCVGRKRFCLASNLFSKFLQILQHVQIKLFDKYLITVSHVKTGNHNSGSPL